MGLFFKAKLRETITNENLEATEVLALQRIEEHQQISDLNSLSVLQFLSSFWFHENLSHFG